MNDQPTIEHDPVVSADETQKLLRDIKYWLQFIAGGVILIALAIWWHW